MSAKTIERTHEVAVRRIGPGAYRAEDLLQDGGRGCGWVGPLREGHWWEAKRQAEADADLHVGREPRPRTGGATPSRPVRIADELWSPVLEVAAAEGKYASDVVREALAADPRVAARLAAAEA